MNVCRTLFRAGQWIGPLLCMSSCMNASSHSPVVVAEPLREFKSSRIKPGLRLYDRSCEADAQIDPGCALGALPVFEISRCDGIERAAMPVIQLPPDVMPFDCSIEARSLGEIPFTIDPGWRSKCVEREDGSHECTGVLAMATLTPDQELDPPIGVQGVLTLSCHDFLDESRPLVMSSQLPLSAVFTPPSCESASLSQ